MPSMVYVRHVCDRCAEAVSIEMAPNVEAPTLPPGWRHIFLMDTGGEPTLLCTNCLDGLRNWIGVRTPALTLVKT